METDQLKEQLAEAVRAGDDSAALHIALDLIDQLEKTIDEQNAAMKKLRMRNYFAHLGDEPRDHEEPFRIYQEKKVAAAE